MELRSSLRTSLCIAILLLFGCSLRAQQPDDNYASVVRHPGWSYGLLVVGGSSVTAGPTAGNLGAAFHAGRVLTGERGSGWRRGTLEWDVNLIPVEYFWVNGTSYGGGFEPVIGRWNFTHGRRRFVPFSEVALGMILSPRNLPPGDTSRVNFTAAWDTGARWFVRPKQSLDVAVRVHHLSNAQLGETNPAINVSLQLMLGYTWQ